MTHRKRARKARRLLARPLVASFAGLGYVAREHAISAMGQAKYDGLVLKHLRHACRTSCENKKRE